MYESHFGLRQRPFRPTPDSAWYYPATTHERALAQLVQTLADDEGMALLTGEPGTGKTLLCHRLLEQLGPETSSAFLTNTHTGNRTGLLQALLYDFSLPYEGRSEQELRLTLTEYLLNNFAAGRRAVIIVDEAHNLPPDLLEELRMLGNLEARQGKAVQVVLVAQPSILETLRQPPLAALRQRLAVQPQLEPFDVHEATDYLLHRLRTAGGRPETIITDEALEILARGGKGIPRLLNQATHQALTMASQAEARQVDAEAALEALAALSLEVDTASPDAEELHAAKGGAEGNGDTLLMGEGHDCEPMLAGEEAGEDTTAAAERAEVSTPLRPLFATPRRPA